MERAACGIFGSLGGWKCLFGKHRASRDRRGATHQQGPLEAGGALGPVSGYTEGTLPIRKRGFGPCTSPGAGSLQSQWDLLLTKQSSFRGAHKAIRAGADLHMQEPGSLCP